MSFTFKTTLKVQENLEILQAPSIPPPPSQKQLENPHLTCLDQQHGQAFFLFFFFFWPFEYNFNLFCVKEKLPNSPIYIKFEGHDWTQSRKN
jgi:hypothetical protein